MKHLKLYLILFVIIFSSSHLFSQEQDAGGSAYSIFGIGDLSNFTGTRTYSMGIVGNSLFGNYINTLNPATITKLNSTLITLNGNYGFLKSSDGTLQNKVSNGNILGINIGIPFDSNFVFALGFNPYSLVDYKIRINGTTGGGQNYVQTYSGKGGVSRINAALSYNFFKKISVGFEYNYSFGEIKNQNYINFNSQSFTNTNIKVQSDFQKSFLKGGIVFELGKILKSKSKSVKDLSIGFVYQSGFNLTATQDGIYENSIATDTLQLNKGEIEIPELFGAGITNIFGDKYVVSADLLMQDWSKFREFNKSFPNFQKSVRAGIGIEILPSPDKNSFWQTMTYRLGGFYDKLFYKVNNEDIISYGIRAGVNIPVRRYNSIDLGFNYSIKGKAENGLIKDEFFNITAGINFGELWFIR
jgi:hypothetical protein